MKIFSLSSRLLFLALLISFAWPSQAFDNEKKACKTHEYRQFDFWIGNWEVMNAKGEKVGENHIYPILNGCALSENWVNVKGTAGVSYNFYNQDEKHWHQTWVDEEGGSLNLNGKLVNGQMILSGARTDKEGKSVTDRITWTSLKDGRVKQHWEISEDSGQSWKDLFVGFYQKSE
ncbi:hypothetical protein [Aliikangiella sp. G2MR2-5]|uniref:hypothetical protein n=1 Tax=Aliikangiella sp. G2MR2-5 TaxID=2788943 RepID=UPI0018A8FA93|nr:hypothetical protein [Aliikangiella sp. G2MR2-5]